MVTERTVPERLIAALPGQIAAAVRALSAFWLPSGRKADAAGIATGSVGHDPAQGADAPCNVQQRIKDAEVSDAPEVAQVVIPYLGEMQHVVRNLGAHAGLAGKASGHLASLSRNGPSSPQGSQRQRSGSTQTAPANFAESAFVSGAAQSLEASIDHASAAITGLAVAIASAAASASPPSALAEDLAQHADATIARLCEATRQISEIVAFIQKDALQTNLAALDGALGAARAAGSQGSSKSVTAGARAMAIEAEQTSSDIYAIARTIINGADEAHQMIGAVSEVIARMRDAMLTFALQESSPVDAKDFSDGGHDTGTRRGELMRSSGMLGSRDTKSEPLNFPSIRTGCQ